MTAILLTAAACGSDGDAGYGGYDGADKDSATSEEGQDQQGGADTTLQVAKGTSAGDVVADSDGYTLYMFTQDSTEPPTSTCAADCAQQWPPALAEGDPTAEGVESALVGTMEREDGETQVTIAGWPLYRYAGDVSPGDVNGQAMGGSWYAVAPDGRQVEGDGTGGAEDGDGTHDMDMDMDGGSGGY
ncbi:putative lipoprotein with Yx(FWY)xxD motif [Nocardiopsis mwathae]|uniref:Putative lipoprotein with Yx(FWY)xxD motif n=1 Tax=Nocardiopsis mwathae TaxID=1472723 RepID=A0A7X0D7B8_9ACTN|nr:hypothetical protein [Nocardiopsis mwathae]MBB6173571.1 putative lipoprotein with Yx(FWY)xxD motif [Nocardiopsis mwathae]